MVKYSIIIVVSILAIIVGALKFTSGNSSSNQTLGEATSNLPAVNSSDWVKGEKGAKVTLIEYSDFQCPACATYYPILKQLNQEFGDKMQFVYRHFPLKKHLNAELVARAAEAAGRQEKFWEMHDLIFENQGKWSDDKNAEAKFVKYAQSLNLDLEKFKANLNSQEIKEKVKSDLQGGLGAGVSATPTFFLNGVKLQNPQNYEEFKRIIEDTIKNNP